MVRQYRAVALAGAALLLLAAGEAPTLTLAPAPSEAQRDIHALPSMMAPAAETLPEQAGVPRLPSDEGLADVEPSVAMPEFTIAPPRSLVEALRHASPAAHGADDAEFDCLARAVYFESKGEPLEGQLAVARVILNRVASPRFPDSICGVVRQPSQFSFVRRGTIPPVRDQRAFAMAREVAAVALEGSWSSMAQRATHFHARRVSPGWRLERVASIGNHVFYR